MILFTYHKNLINSLSQQQIMVAGRLPTERKLKNITVKTKKLQLKELRKKEIDSLNKVYGFIRSLILRELSKSLLFIIFNKQKSILRKIDVTTLSHRVKEDCIIYKNFILIGRIDPCSMEKG